MLTTLKKLQSEAEIGSHDVARLNWFVDLYLIVMPVDCVGCPSRYFSVSLSHTVLWSDGVHSLDWTRKYALYLVSVN